ncbi:uncharacterized protein Z518_09317 [Rhinocladiella mackenziei CBS 650.93]|uniref:Zinc/iron permease n=1 Tax=Rhinocladiella mackenziei CBS 650.93 TaxID=1442369 RepID=A0A0D2IEC6_9EURO|nr:uncharacterized protein Z518_09317 [Rhinocladiella mackenziei CBS 650.93]KIX01591.1 hypothetical protein Z518_09317 [Rhinocladiella mackenziei CBS 650.93]
MWARILFALALIDAVTAQTTYTGCHNHSTVEYCYGPDGQETPLVTYSLPVSTTLSTATIPAQVSATATTTEEYPAVTGCHTHGSQIYCINGEGEEVLISTTATPTGESPAQYTDCHNHGEEQYCVGPSGEEVLVVAEGTTSSDEDEGEQEVDCHFHAGVEHCVPVGESESSSSASCGLQERDYDIPLRIGTLFVVLVTSGMGVFAPLLLVKIPFQNVNTWVFTIVKQFGTGVIVSTAFVHLYTHASLMFNNECLGTLDYEATTSAIVMAGIFLAFLFEYIGHRIVLSRAPNTRRRRMTSSEWTTTAASSGKETSPQDDSAKNTDNQANGLPSSNPERAEAENQITLANLGHHHGCPFDPTNPNSKLSVLVMEAGVLFHSILIGLTLVVAGDSFYRTLLVVIVFHQFFEGLALGARIASVPRGTASFWPTKALMAAAFTLITPLGMAIGLGVIHDFNGNDRSTILTIGTLDALSAGILAWVGMVDMWARDWVVEGGEMTGSNLSVARIGVGLTSLIVGFVGMSVLGKWA